MGLVNVKKNDKVMPSAILFRRLISFVVLHEWGVSVSMNEHFISVCVSCRNYHIIDEGRRNG